VKPRLTRLLRASVAVAGLVFMGAALVGAARNPDLAVLPSPAASVTALIVIVTGLWGGARAWAQLLDRPLRPDLARGFFMAQFGKYVPGGIWQAVGQISDATARAQVNGGTATAAFVAQALVTVSAGLTVAAGIALVPTAPLWARTAAPIAAGASILMLSKPAWFTSLAARIGPLHRRLAVVSLPDGGQLLRSWAWTLPSIAAAGVVFVIALEATAAGVVPAALPVFAVAWTIGFLALPFPAGLGVREGVLVLLLPAQDPVAIVAAGAILRLAYIIGEAVAVGTTWRPRTGTPDEASADDVGAEAQHDS
jgi:uncharacterized membrane protein YbhN (UPF0104 family)